MTDGMMLTRVLDHLERLNVPVDDDGTFIAFRTCHSPYYFDKEVHGELDTVPCVSLHGLGVWGAQVRYRYVPGFYFVEVFDDNPILACGHGLHFYFTRAEARFQEISPLVAVRVHVSDVVLSTQTCKKARCRQFESLGLINNARMRAFLKERGQ